MASSSDRPLRLMIFDRTCTKDMTRIGLSRIWRAGSWLYRGLGRIDAAFGAATWDEAWSFLAEYEAERPIAQIQYWGHGTFGRVLIARQPFGSDHLRRGPWTGMVDRVARRMLRGEEGLVWLRTCEAFGGHSGQRFAMALADTFGCRVAGHTHVIGALQSGLVSLLPGQPPYWPAEQGLVAGEAATGRDSAFGEPDTVTFLHNTLPRDVLRQAR